MVMRLARDQAFGGAALFSIGVILIMYSSCTLDTHRLDRKIFLTTLGSVLIAYGSRMIETGRNLLMKLRLNLDEIENMRKLDAVK